MNNNKIWSEIEMRDNDIVIASTVKSGTTWLQQIVAQLTSCGEHKDNICETSIWIDNGREYNQEQIIEILNKQRNRRFFKTHSPSNIVLMNKNKNSKYIFITRDFRDVVWSFYNHFINSKYRKKHKSNITTVEIKLRECKNPYDFWKIVIENKHLFNEYDDYRIIWSYFNTIKTWLDVKDNKNILILHFNDLKNNLNGNINKISEFLGYNYDEEILNKIYEKCTFDWMKKNSRKCVPPNFINKSNNFINKGINKRWKNILTEDDLEIYNKIISSFFDKKTIEWIENGLKNN
jgi:aryl sulfotransferase